MTYAYAWYQIIGMCTLAGILIVLAFRGLDLFLEWWLGRKLKASLRRLNAGFDKLPRRNPGASLRRQFPKDDSGA